MYWNTTPKTIFRKGKKSRNSWFTLVEIMIVILIIVLLSQMGNIGGLFRSRERNKVEEVAVKIVAAIDEEKVNALLGKTLDGKIVRKRLIEINFVTENTITLTSEVNLSETDESTYDADSKMTKSWSLTGLQTEAYNCPDETSLTGIEKIEIEFENDKINFISDDADIADHTILLLKHTNTAHEIHIDRRTGLTYDRSTGRNNDGTWQVNCN